jgi:hypothetical protein
MVILRKNDLDDVYVVPITVSHVVNSKFEKTLRRHDRGFHNTSSVFLPS